MQSEYLLEQIQALRGLALCAEKGQDSARAKELLEQSLALVEKSEWPLRRTDALVAMGAFLLRADSGSLRGASALAEARKIYGRLGLNRAIDDFGIA